ncbi:MAG: hypothetical protein GX785_09135 [Armatimonadetes bacterium]|nr:hypothetical protein [Armatimonadota bacterium]HOM81881.1 hypothetical protein [Armatimonadota bacterium]
MDDVPITSGTARSYLLVNRIFVALVVFSIGYVIWRGFAAESARRATPLFGEVSLLECEGRKRPFRLVCFADLSTAVPGQLVIREGEPGAVVWRLVSREGDRLRLERQRYGRTEVLDLKLPLEAGTPRYILVAPEPKG